MILTDQALRAMARRALDPVPDTHAPISVDVSVGEDVAIPPGEVRVVPTLEDIDMPTDACAMVTGRSSHMRRGVFMPGGWVDPGYSSDEHEPFVLEFFNLGDEPLELEEGDAGARLVFFGLASHTFGYTGRWSG